MIKQDMPPPGGYSPIIYKYVPIKKGLSAVSKMFIMLAAIGVAGYMYRRRKEHENNNRIEMRCARLALRPMLEAEMDRLMLKQFKRNRDTEEQIMKDVKGWEVGKFYNTPIYFSVGPDEYYIPSPREYYAVSSIKWYNKSARVTSEI